MTLRNAPDVSLQILFNTGFLSGHMINDLPVLHLNSTNLVGTLAASDLVSPVVSLGLLLAVVVSCFQPCCQQGNGGGLVLPLAALGVASHEKPCRPVLYLNGGFRFVPLLTAGARTATSGDFTIRFSDGKSGAGNVWEHGNRDRAGVNFILSLVGRNSLPAMPTGFHAEEFPGFFTSDLQDNQSVPLVHDSEVKANSVGTPWRTRSLARAPMTSHRLRLLRHEFQSSNSWKSPELEFSDSAALYHKGVTA